MAALVSATFPPGVGGFVATQSGPADVVLVAGRPPVAWTGSSAGGAAGAAGTRTYFEPYRALLP
ncbi:MAG: hypothetical protein WCP53_09405 [Verrucomicrobiota bacterium]